MIRTVVLALVMTGVVGVSGVEGQRRDRGSDSPIEALINLRDRLDLTDAQVSSLTALDSTLQAQNRPVVTQLMGVRRNIRALGHRRDFTPEQRARFDAYIEEARPLMQQIRDNTTAAMRQVRTILTEAQRERLSNILRDRDDRRRDSQPPRQN